MTKTFFAAAALLAAISAPAFAKDVTPEKQFTRDGETYVYTTVTKANRVVISGRRYPAGSTFELVVRGNQVTGISDGQAVSFTVPNAQAKLTSTALASR